MRRLLSGLLICSITGCYTYVPVGDAVPEAGKEVRAHLVPAQDFPLGEFTVRDVTQVDGTVFQATSDTLALWSEWLRSELGTRFGSHGNVYYVPRSQVPRLEVRRLHPAKTVVAVGIVVGLAVGVFAFAADQGGGGGTEPPPVPLPRLAFPIPF